MFGRTRFPGAGKSAEARFNAELRNNLREGWKAWSALVVGMLALCVWSGVAGGVGGRFLLFTAGALFGAALTVFCLGGHISAFNWWLGAEGERETAKQIERLSVEWHCEHDLVHEHGNWDHLLVGPAGTFVLDSKYLHGRAEVRSDGLVSGRLRFRGATFRGNARRIKTELEGLIGSSPGWVQAVVVVWGDFPQRTVEEDRVVYLAADELVPWLESQSVKLNAPRRAAVVAALGELRSSLRVAA